MKKLMSILLAALSVLFAAAPAGAQQFSYGISPTGTKVPIAVDAGGHIIMSTAAALGLVQVAGVNGTTVATNANPFPVRPSADGANPVDATHPLAVRPSADGTNPVDATHPLHVRVSDGAAGARLSPWGVAVDSYVGGEVGLNVAAQNYVLPVAGVWYCMTAQGGSACVLCGAGAPPAVNMTTDCTFLIPEGATRCEILTGPNCGVISSATIAAGYLRFTYRQ